MTKKRTPAMRWSASFRRLCKFMIKTRDMGCIDKLANKWSGRKKEDFTEEIDEIIGVLEGWKRSLEGSK